MIRLLLPVIICFSVGSRLSPMGRFFKHTGLIYHRISLRHLVRISLLYFFCYVNGLVLVDPALVFAEIMGKPTIGHAARCITTY